MHSKTGFLILTPLDRAALEGVPFAVLMNSSQSNMMFQFLLLLWGPPAILLVKGHHFIKL